MIRLVALCAALSACTHGPAWHHPRAAIAGGIAMTALSVVALNSHQDTPCDGSSCISAGFGDGIVNGTTQAAGEVFLLGGLAAIGVGLVALSREREPKPPASQNVAR
jgi:hypothetical protein